jgi:hypothetical protein
MEVGFDISCERGLVKGYIMGGLILLLRSCYRVNSGTGRSDATMANFLIITIHIL